MTHLSVRREVTEFRKRYKWMVLAVIAAFVVLASRAVELQLVEQQVHAAQALANITKTILLPALRGEIRDASGRSLATNDLAYQALVTPQFLRSPGDVRTIEELMSLDDTERMDFERRLREVPENRRSQQIEMFQEITREQFAALATHARELPGVDSVASWVRRYPYGELAAHVIGYLNEVNGDDLARSPEFRPGDRIGRTGIEMAWDSYLRGRPGFHRVVVDARGRERAEHLPPGERTQDREPIPGNNVVLTVDMDFTRAVERAFRAIPAGAAAVVDVRTGRVRALYSKPAYDLNEMAGRLSAARFAEVQADIHRPLIDKTAYESYFPGSIFKPFTALAALTQTAVDPHAPVVCEGSYEIGNRRFRCSQTHGAVDMRRALVQSCNIYFWKLAAQVTLDQLAHTAHDFGLGEPSGLGINSETRGFVPTRDWYERQQGDRFRLGFTLNAAIGQGSTRVSVIQLAMAYAALANGGQIFVPQLVERIASPDGRIIENFEPRLRRRVEPSRELLAYVVDGLYGVVNDPNGTAFDARVADGVPVAGKTGTAQVQRVEHADLPAATEAYLGRDHAWFAGFAPAGDPEIAVVVLVEHGGTGGRTAAPIAMEIVGQYFARNEHADVDATGGPDGTEP